VSFIRAVHGWEVETFATCFKVIVRQEGKDKLWWVPSKRGLFGVKSFYKVKSCHDCLFPLEKCLVVYGSVEGGHFCVASGPGKDPYHRLL
jgi:hypothetical protein